MLYLGRDRGRVQEPDGVESYVPLFRQWIALRNTHSALRNGTYRSLVCSGGFYAFSRENTEETVIVLINNSDREQVLDEALWHQIEEQTGGVSEKTERIAAMTGMMVVAGKEPQT